MADMDHDATDPSEQFREFTGTKPTKSGRAGKLPDSHISDPEAAALPQTISKSQKG